MKSTLRIILLLAAAAALAGCGDMLKGKSLAEPEVGVFPERLNHQRFDEIYTAAGDEFRKAASKEKVLELLSAIDRKLGPAKSWTTKTWNIRSFNLVTNVVLVEDTVFEKGTGTETFTFHVSGDKATLVGYFINSTDMMTK